MRLRMIIRGDSWIEAFGLLKSMETRICFHIRFLAINLKRVWKSISYFTKPIDFSWNVGKFVHSEISFVQSFREKFSDIEGKAKLPNTAYQTSRKKQTRYIDGRLSNTFKVVSVRDLFRVGSFIVTNLKQCTEVHKNIVSTFYFLANLNLSDDDVKKRIILFQIIQPNTKIKLKVSEFYDFSF